MATSCGTRRPWRWHQRKAPKASESLWVNTAVGGRGNAHQRIERVVAIGGVVPAGGDHHFRIEGQPGFGQRLLVALELLVVATRGEGIEEADALVADADQMADGAGGAAAIVDADDIDARIGPGDQRDDGEMPAQGAQVTELVVDGGIDQHAIDAAGPEQLDEALFLAELVVRGGEQRAVAALGEGEFHLLGRARERGVHDVRQDKPDGLGLAAHQ